MPSIRKALIGAALVGSTLAGGAIGAALIGTTNAQESPSTTAPATSPTPATSPAPADPGGTATPPAGAAGPGRDAAPPPDPTKGGHVGANGVKEELLTGDTAEKVKAAAARGGLGGHDPAGRERRRRVALRGAHDQVRRQPGHGEDRQQLQRHQHRRRAPLSLRLMLPACESGASRRLARLPWDQTRSGQRSPYSLRRSLTGMGNRPLPRRRSPPTGTLSQRDGLGYERPASRTTVRWGVVRGASVICCTPTSSTATSSRRHSSPPG